MIPVNTPLLQGNEKKYLNECIDTGWISSEGPFVSKFEELFSEKTGRKYGIAVSNGSVALDAAVLALGIGAGDEVIMPAFTIISCAAAIVRAGATPVLVDCDPETWNMDISQIEGKITSRTKAIMVVHIYGLPVDMDPVLSLADKYNLRIIEDAAEMHGQTYKGKPCGSFGDISTFSFYPNKHITTGEGGMIMTNDPQLAEKCRSVRNLCFVPEKRFIHYELGYNMRMTNLQAALGLAQLEQLDDFVLRKRAIGFRYHQHLSGLPNLQLPVQNMAYAENIYWVFGIVSPSEETTSAIVKELGENKIGTRPFFWCMHEQPVFQKMGLFLNEHYPVAEKIARCGFYLPSGLGLTNAEIDFVAEKLKNILKKIS
ncbi:MAG: DegT/DnrJ/EryC1/StrS family aminotransferase [Chitinophagaceae bacterium]